MHKQLAKAICIIKGDYQSPDLMPEYEVIDMGEDQISIIHITNGLYKGTQYRCGKVGFIPDGDEVCLSFTTDIIKHPWWGNIKDLDQDFTKISGNVLRAIINKIVNSADVEYNKFLVM